MKEYNDEDIEFYGKHERGWDIFLVADLADEFRAFLFERKVSFTQTGEELAGKVSFYLDGKLTEEKATEVYNEFRILKGLRPD
jgi:hypothetical protein